VRITGWQRLWLVAAIVWGVAVLSLVGGLQWGNELSAPRPTDMLLGARKWLVPVVAVYALGWGLAWVRRGFARAPH